jgi:hypothetical protein
LHDRGKESACVIAWNALEPFPVEFLICVPLTLVNFEIFYTSTDFIIDEEVAALLNATLIVLLRVLTVINSWSSNPCWSPCGPAASLTPLLRDISIFLFNGIDLVNLCFNVFFTLSHYVFLLYPFIFNIIFFIFDPCLGENFICNGRWVSILGSHNTYNCQQD